MSTTLGGDTNMETGNGVQQQPPRKRGSKSGAKKPARKASGKKAAPKKAAAPAVPRKVSTPPPAPRATPAEPHPMIAGVARTLTTTSKLTEPQGIDLLQAAAAAMKLAFGWPGIPVITTQPTQPAA
jgi:hypothetical protein